MSKIVIGEVAKRPEYDYDGLEIKAAIQEHCAAGALHNASPAEITGQTVTALHIRTDMEEKS